MNKKITTILLSVFVLIFTFSSVLIAEDAEYQDGRYVGYVPDDHGDVVVEVVIEHKAIADVNIVNPFKLEYDYEEGRQYWLEFPHMVLSEQSTEELDAVSGATGSYERLTEATNQALSIADGTYDDNKYYGIAKDFEHGHVVVEITVENDEMTDFNFITANPDLEDDSREKLMPAKDEDYALEEAHEYFEEFPEKAVENQGNVDLVSGVTGSYESFNAALDMAMEQADLK
ncbi:MAG: FMN-binding protein [Bacillota bacterium]